MSVTARFALPLLSAGQAQKELHHNEALTLLDALAQPSAESAGSNTPPGDPAPGQCWIVGPAPAAAWAGRGGALAIWTAGGWRYATPREGMAIWVRDVAVTAHYRSGEWEMGVVRAAALTIGDEQVVGARQASIALPAGGIVVDPEGRAAIAAILSALQAHGLIASE